MTKRHAPATSRNREPILKVLKQHLSSTGNILEIASGTGEHGVFFAPYFSQQQWIPSDQDPECLASIKSWRRDSSTDNLQSPLTIDVMKENWHQSLTSQNIRSLICINMIHISPWEACVGLIKGASKILPSGGVLYLYGPYKVNNKQTAISNEQFDESLRLRNPLWGIRDLESVAKLAQKNDLHLKEKIAMPANNFSLIFEKG